MARLQERLREATRPVEDTQEKRERLSSDAEQIARERDQYFLKTTELEIQVRRLHQDCAAAKAEASEFQHAIQKLQGEKAEAYH